MLDFFFFQAEDGIRDTSDLKLPEMTTGKVPRDPARAVKPATVTDQSIYGVLRETAGKIESQTAGTEKGKLASTYHIAYIAHCPLEPRAAVAQWQPDGKLNVWTGTQV